MEETPTQKHETEGEAEKDEREDPVEQERELRLVLLGWAGSGKSSVGNTILRFKAFKTRQSADSKKPVSVACEKKCASVAGRQVVVVDTSDWFYSERPPEEVHRQLFLCESLSAPGPHGFLLCFPDRQTNEQDLQALDALEVVFGPESVSKHTIVIFTHAAELSKDPTLDDRLSSEHKEQLELLKKCGGRYHTLKVQGEGEEVDEEERKSVEELLEKVEKMVKESEEEFYTFPPLPKMDLGVSERDEPDGKDLEEDVSAKTVRRRGGGEEEDGCEENGDGQEVLEDEESTLSPPSPPPSFLRWLWDSVIGLVMMLPTLVRGSTLLGSLVGLFFGGAMGATVGSVATEVGRRKKNNKVKSQ
ncbi:GTPase IMAP family member 1 [Hoplias malabaricus]|uniref:GTPase IMAP family member 1 n=1 Tax=Hoplias malabaricus TaxID=27720 RepID=UPI0034630512